MTKRKVSVTLSPERLRRAQEVSGTSNLSELVDDALEALVERALERQWLDAHPATEETTDLPTEVPVDLRAVPWDEP